MTTAVATVAYPAPWPVPQEWSADEPCFVLCSGESIGKQAKLIQKLKGRFIAVKHGLLLKPDADVLFMPGECWTSIVFPLLKQFKGAYAIIRSKFHPELPESVKRVTRSKHHQQLCERRDHVSGYDSGTSAINLAYHFGARTIVLLGYDMTGGHFCKHPLQHPPQGHFRQHMIPLHAFNADAKSKGVRIVNCSPTSVVTAFEKQPLGAFL
jgi:hypothetical protein